MQRWKSSVEYSWKWQMGIWCSMATRLKLRDRCQCLTILGLNVRLDYKVWKHIHVEYLELSLIHFTADPFSPLYLSCCMLNIKSRYVASFSTGGGQTRPKTNLISQRKRQYSKIMKFPILWGWGLRNTFV